MSNAGAASLAALIPARAAASRKNGARSRGPKTPEGKARSAQNALKHGLCAQRFTVVGDEDPREFAALEAALLEELAPRGALQTVLARRVVAAAWRLERAEQMEAELFARVMDNPFGRGDLGLALIRDCNGAGAFETLLRYRGRTLAELWRALRTLKALQAEAAQQARAPGAAEADMPIEPEPRAIPDESAPAPPPHAPSTPAGPASRQEPSAAAHTSRRIEPENRRDPGRSPAMPRELVRALAELLATGPVPPGRRSFP